AQIKVEVTATDAGGLSTSESFAIEVADVNEGPDGIKMDGGPVAENVEGAVVGTLSVIDPDAADTHSFEVSDDRFEVVDGQLKLKDGIALNHEDAAQIKVEVTATDAGGLSTSESFAIEVVEVPDMALSTGFEVKYFDVDHSLKSLDQIDWAASPTYEELKPDINYKNGSGSFWEGGAKDTFGAQITGNIEVSEAGTFTFHMGGDDGTMLFIDGQPVLVDDGLHAYRTRSQEVELEPGTHHIEVRYFENYGQAGLKLEWEGPGLDGKELVSAPDIADAQTVGGVELAVDLGLDTTALAKGTILTVTDLPPGTELAAGNAQQTVGADGTADLTGWDVSLLTLAPPADFEGNVDAVFDLAVPSSSGQMVHVSEPFPFQVNTAHVAPPSVEVVGGFQASYFDVDQTLRKIDDVDWTVDPTHEEFVQDINYENSSGSFWDGGSKDTFGVQLEGQISVETGGTYTFTASGDDGVVVYINGKEVVDNDGLHGYRARSGEIELEPGTYEIEVKYFENYGHAGLKLEWEGPDTDGRELVTADEVTHIAENGTWDIGVELSGTSPDATLSMTGLPPDTILMSGDQSMVTDGGPADLTGWNTQSLEVCPPPGFEGVIDGQLEVTDLAFNGSPVASVTEFSLTVGDPQAPKAQDDMEMVTMMASPQQAEGAGGWDSAEAQFDDEMEDMDVMAEQTISKPGADVSDIEVDTHERADW
ncbi:MAG: PA14 domain-containing protein, partial [Pseudomonadota bacterium]